MLPACVKNRFFPLFRVTQNDINASIKKNETKKPENGYGRLHSQRYNKPAKLDEVAV